MIAARAAARPRATALQAVASHAFVAVAGLGALALGVPDVGRYREAVTLGSRILAAHSVPLVFGPETAAAGADGGALGWLAATANAALTATPLGFGGCAAAAALCVLLGLALVERRARGVAPQAYALGAVGLVVLSSLDLLHVGGATSLLLFGAALVAALDSATPAGIVAVGVLTALWCNVDAAGVLAPAFALANACGRALEDRTSLATRYAWLATAAALLATLATPATLHFPYLAVASLRLAGTFASALPWAPADVAPHGYHIGFMLLLVAALALGLRACGPREALLGTLALVVALASGALLPLAAIVVAPMLAAAAARGRVAAPPALAWPIAGVWLVALSLAFGSMYGARAASATAPANEPQATLAVLAATGDVRGVACANVAWCDGAVALGLRVLADDRIGAMPLGVRRAQGAIARAGSTWRTELDAFGIDAVVVGENAALATLIAASDWHRTSRSGTIAVYVRPGHRP